MAQIEVRESEIKIMQSKILLYEKIEKIETLFKQRGEEEEKEYIVTAGTYKKGELEEGWPKINLQSLNYMKHIVK